MMACDVSPVAMFLMNIVTRVKKHIVDALEKKGCKLEVSLDSISVSVFVFISVELEKY